jgi:hypothetical protein
VLNTSFFQIPEFFWKERAMKRIIETTFDLRRRAPILRRGFLQKAAGAGFVLSSGLSTPVRADEDHEDNDKTVHCAVPLPQPHTTAGPFGPLHFYFPGPIDGSAAATDGTGTHPEGRDPSTITNFSGFVGAADLLFSGTATDTNSGAKATYQFHTDTRFMQGEFIASDEQRHRGAFAFI